MVYDGSSRGCVQPSEDLLAQVVRNYVYKLVGKIPNGPFSNVTS